MRLPIFEVDAFSSQVFRGNPAAVCPLSSWLDDATMQAIAAENNLSETAFVVGGDGAYEIRWMTPKAEVDLCGHATLASAHVLWEDGHLKPDQQARFETRSGLLTADRRGDWIELDFPVKAEETAEPPERLAEALGTKPKYVGRNRFDYVVEVESETVLRALKPNFTLLGEISVRGVIVTARAETNGYDFISRFFAPAAGINEDPVTGSSHCCLTPFWAKRLGKTEFLAYQASARGGVLRLRLAGDRVVIGGQAVTVLRGELID